MCTLHGWKIKTKSLFKFSSKQNYAYRVKFFYCDLFRSMSNIFGTAYICNIMEQSCSTSQV